MNKVLGRVSAHLNRATAQGDGGRNWDYIRANLHGIHMIRRDTRNGKDSGGGPTDGLQTLLTFIQRASESEAASGMRGSAEGFPAFGGFMFSSFLFPYTKFGKPRLGLGMGNEVICMEVQLC